MRQSFIGFLIVAASCDCRDHVPGIAAALIAHRCQTAPNPRNRRA